MYNFYCYYILFELSFDVLSLFTLFFIFYHYNKIFLALSNKFFVYIIACTPLQNTPLMYTLTLYRTPHHVYPHSLQNTPLCTPSPSVMLTYAHDERQAITWQKVGHFTYICHNIVVFFTRKCAFWFLSIIKHILKTHQSKTRLRWRLELFILNSNIVILLIYLIVYISNIPI